MYEELLYAGYQSLSMTFQNIYGLALKENDLEKAHMLVGKIEQLATLFEFGEYHAISPGLELATREKDEAQTLRIMERMLANIESLYAFTKSPLYAHMRFKPPEKRYLSEVRESLLATFRDEETYAYLKDNPQWQKLARPGE